MLRWKSSLKPAAAAPGGGTNPGTSNLVAWLGMEEGSSTSVADSTSNNNDFTLTNGSWVTGKVGSYAVRLDGTGDYMDSDANFAVGANVCTVSFWMYWTDSGSDEKFIYELGSRWWQHDGSIAFSWVQNESVFKVSMHDGSGNLEVKFPEPSSSQWVYVTVVHNGPGGSGNAGEIKLYYDGTAQTYSSYSSTKDQASNIGQAGSLFFIGANSTGAQEITIDVDTFAVFSDELTQDEITWMYNGGSGRSYSDVATPPSGLSTPTLLGKRDPTSTGQTTTQIDISSATQGALMIASITVRSTQGNLAGPSESGWTLIASVDNGDATNRPLNQVYKKVAGSSESTVTWTHDSDYTSAVAIEIVGADATSIYDYFTNQASDDLGVVTVPTNGLVIAIHAKGDNGNTSSSTVRDSNNNDQTQYTMLGDAYGATNSGTAIAWGDVGSGDTNGTDKIVGAGSGSRTATHHIALKPAGAATDYRATVLNDNPLFYYRLGESSGATTAYDEVATTANGTYYGTPTLGQTGAISGDSNTSVKFKKADSDYVETLTLSSETSLLPCTIECFMKTDGASDSSAAIIFYRSGGNSASGLNIRGSNQGSLAYHWRNQTNTWQYNPGITLSDNTWYYVALVIESTKATFYVIDESGTLTTPAVNSVSHSALDCSNDGWHFAKDPGYGNRYFQGWLDEIAIYDQALSQSTVVAHAAAAGFSS